MSVDFDSLFSLADNDYEAHLCGFRAFRTVLA